MSKVTAALSKTFLVFSLPLMVISTLLFAGSALADQTGSIYADAQASTDANTLGNFDVEGESEALPDDGREDPKSQIFPAVWCADIGDESTRASCWTAYRNGLDYYEFGLEHRERVLKWQHVSTQIILVVVLLLVAMGLYFAWVQFRAGTGEEAATEIEISSASIKVSSSVLGVIILVISLAFFYLYLIYVYPIEEVI